MKTDHLENNQTELLLPVADWDMCYAAIHNGADAIYLGVPSFNARGRSQDLDLDELKEMINVSHLYGVKVYLALNIVVFQRELTHVVSLLEIIIPMGADAIIVQDLGLAYLLHRYFPEQRVHASTQMTITNADAIDFVSDLNIKRFVLGRENSLEEIKMIRSHTQKELEVFVHGALCVAYSGQCFTSESIGGRSANRGQCAQSCRLPYELYVDDKKVDREFSNYLVSPKDLMGLEELQDLKALGVHSLKIEGRLKTPEYVAAAAKNYKSVLNGEALHLSQRVMELSTTYSRGFYSGWLHGVNHQKLVDAQFSSHKGLEVGQIKKLTKVEHARSKQDKLYLLTLKSTIPLKAGMGLFILSEQLKTDWGAKIFSHKKVGDYDEILLRGLSQDFKRSKAHQLNDHSSKTNIHQSLLPQEGDRVFMNSDESFFAELKKTWKAKDQQKKIPLKFFIQAVANSPLFIKAKDPEGREVYVLSDRFLTPSISHPLSKEQVKKELSSLGNTAYCAESFESYIESGLFLHHKDLKKVRQDLVEKMNQARVERNYNKEIFHQKINEITHLVQMTNQELCQPHEKKNDVDKSSSLNILLRCKDQVLAIINQFSLLEKDHDLIGSFILDFEFGRDYAWSLTSLKQLGFKVGIATTRILKPKEYHHLKNIIRLNPDFVLVRNLGAIAFLQKSAPHIPLRGDFSLNVTNSFSAKYLLDKGLQSLNVSLDLNEKHLRDLVFEMKDLKSKLEITLHQYMPEFHMEHCVFAAFLSHGSSFRDCGKPCEKHSVKLKDPYQEFHYLKADQECRNTFFRSSPQSLAPMVDQLSGVGHFRFEALNEGQDELLHKIQMYLKFLKKEISPFVLSQHLKNVKTT